MKRILYLFIAVLALAGCKKSSFESVFDDRPEVRMQKSIAEVNTILTTAPNGWIASLPTQAGGGYAFYISFDAATQGVKMYGDMTDAAATVVGPSTFRVKANAGAELIFDTYNYINLLDDPNPTVMGNAQATTFKSDVEFIFDHSTADSIVFTGKKYRQPFRLVKATAAQKAIYEAAGYKTAIDKTKAFFAATPYPYIEIVSGAATLKAGISLNTTNNLSAGKRVNFTGVLADGKTVVAGSAKFGFKLDGAELLGSGLSYNGITFVRFVWKDATTLVAIDAAGKEYPVKASPTPITPLFLLLGAGYTTVTLPNATTYSGWGADYVTRRATAANLMLTGGYNLRLEQMAFTFNDVTKKMVLKVNMPQNTTLFIGTINYNYSRTDAGLFKFTPNGADGNGAIIVPFMASLLAQRLDLDTFTVDYLTDPITGSLYAQFKSTTNPTFTFAGALQ